MEFSFACCSHAALIFTVGTKNVKEVMKND